MSWLLPYMDFFCERRPCSWQVVVTGTSVPVHLVSRPDAAEQLKLHPWDCITPHELMLLSLLPAVTRQEVIAWRKWGNHTVTLAAAPRPQSVPHRRNAQPQPKRRPEPRRWLM